MICDYCFMDRILLLKLPVIFLVEDKPPKTIQWGKTRVICTMCIEMEAVLFEQEQAETNE